MILDYVIGTRRAFVATALCCGVLLAGCGGGGGGGGSTPTTRTTPMSLTINWPSRGRDVTAPSSALSARVVVRGASVSGGDLEFFVNRNHNNGAHEQSYSSGIAGYAGSRMVEVRFFTERDGAGDPLGAASFEAQVRSDGYIPTNVAVQSTVASVEVPVGQHAMVQQSTALVATAYDNGHAAIAVQGDAFRWAVADGDDNLKFVDNMAMGRRQGSASVTASVDGLTSSAVAVEVRNGEG